MNSEQADALRQTLKARFDKNMHRHAAMPWSLVETALERHPAALRSLAEMEASGGEPDVIAHREESGSIVFCDCSPETPVGRRSICYDRAALDGRKENKPRSSALDMAAEMGIALLTEAQYRALQQMGEFDKKSSSWIATPPELRALGGALFCDRRYGRVFTYHNGAESYYAARGFRGMLRV